jgi:hypothetical protein
MFKMQQNITKFRYDNTKSAIISQETSQETQETHQEGILAVNCF